MWYSYQKGEFADEVIFFFFFSFSYDVLDLECFISLERYLIYQIGHPMQI